METVLSGVPLVAATRGALVESVHAGVAHACDVEGRVLLSLGDVDTPVFLRSSAKPFIAAAVVRAGAAERFGFDARELAVMSASHNGEDFHLEAVRSILHKSGVPESALQCGAHAPAYGPAAHALAQRGETYTAVHNNCSGKHAGILALARVMGAPIATYLEPDHPAQTAILALCERVFNERFGPDRLGIDGCGIPAIALPLRSAALGFARFATLAGLEPRDRAALERVRDAMAEFPQYVGGTDRFDTDLMRATGGTIVCKAGAEGVHCDALLNLGAGFALKIVDGTRRAAAPATIGILRELGALDDAAVTQLRSHAVPALTNVAGRTTGILRYLNGQRV